MERIWLYTHPDAKIEDEMKETKKQKTEEDKPKENIFSKLKSLFSFNDDETESQVNQEQDNNDNEDNNNSDMDSNQDEMENALLKKFIGSDNEDQQNLNTSETQNIQEDEINETNNEEVAEVNQNEETSEENQNQEENNTQNQSNEEQISNEENKNNNETLVLIQIPNDEQFNELDFFDENEENDQDSKEQFTVFNQNLATIINLNTQSISDFTVNKNLNNNNNQIKEKKNKSKYLQQMIKEEFTDDLFDTPPMNFQTQFLQKIQLDELQRLNLKFLSSQQCHHQSILPLPIQLDFTEYLITHTNLAKDIYFVRHVETNDVLSSESLEFTSKVEMKDGFLINDIIFNDRDEFLHSIRFQAPITKENLVLLDLQEESQDYSLGFDQEKKSLFSLVSLDNKNNQQVKLNDEILTDQEIVIINNKTNSFLIRENQKQSPIFTQYNNLFQNYQIEHATWMLHSSESVFCSNVRSSVMIKPKFQQKFWNEQYFYIYNPTFNVYLTADLVLSDEVTQSEDVFEIEFDKTSTQFSLISKKYQLPVQLNQNTNEIILNPLSYAQEKLNQQHKFVLMSLETSSTDFYIIVNSQSQRILSVEQMENFISLTNDDAPVVFQLWELIPAVQMEE
eukprot:TRINITY_DN1409_c0_g1_i4.p2 TRINITY_DN1409_c0_g1~~TRINITY_DN1409_c0_g1_i4.p2  ORF type:complete len:622 (-),score=130.10 TRINITY_DN1409_c0_g1_i4:63-1928(-)